MKSIFRIALAALALVLPTVSLAAAWGDCCCWDPCKGGPLCCGKLSLMVKGGVTPSSFSNRGDIWGTDPALGVFSLGSTSKFSTHFDVPWNVGAELAWNASCRIQFFLEYAHTQATGKSSTRDFVIPFDPPFTLSLNQKFGDYKVNAGYLGARYYFEGCCFPCIGKISPFVGFKTGFATQARVLAHYTGSVNGSGIDESFKNFLERTQVSGGLLVGLEWWFCNCWSLVLQGEFVGTCGLTPNRNVEVFPPSQITVTNLNVGSTGWILSWPITLGVRWTF